MDIEIKKEQIPLILIIALGIFFIYLASQTQMLGEDEAFYYSLGKDFSEMKYPAFYGPNSPMVLMPFLPLVYAIPFAIFGASLGLAKMIVAIFGILTMIIVYLIGKKTNFYYGLSAAFLLLSITLFTHFMFISYQEVPIAFFSSLVTYMLLTTDSKKKSILTGAVLALAFFTKQSALIFLPIIILYAIFIYLYKKDRKYLKFSFISVVVAIVLISPFVIRNIILYNYPYTQLLNSIFTSPQNVGWEGLTSRMLSPIMLSVGSYASSFGWLIVLSVIFGMSWFIVDVGSKNKISKELFLFTLISVVLLVSYYMFYILDVQIVEPRYIAIIFPQLSLIGGFFLWKLKEANKYFIIIIGLVLIISIYSSALTAYTTSVSQRYPADYIQALTWLRQSTPNDSLILTTYGGSVKYFAERDTIWNIKELPTVMSSQDSTYIYDIMEKYNVSYILVWRGVLGQDFIIPQSNLIGMFTYNFLNNVMNDTQNFNITYQNQNNVIFKVL
ncbi:MAG: glycosyltransferase family 39 protein [Candidatus Aenigmatarchaeota archaeon]